MCGITTDASIVLNDTRKAKLTLNNKNLTVKILSPSNATFTVTSAEQAPPQKTNTGVKRLEINVPSQTGQVQVVMLLSPDWNGTESVFLPRITSLSEW